MIAHYSKCLKTAVYTCSAYGLHEGLKGILRKLRDDARLFSGLDFTQKVPVQDRASLDQSYALTQDSLFAAVETCLEFMQLRGMDLDELESVEITVRSLIESESEDVDTLIERLSAVADENMDDDYPLPDEGDF